MGVASALRPTGASPRPLCGSALFGRGRVGRYVGAVQAFSARRATSLGGVESLIEHRASIEGDGSPCPPNLLRLSTGLENVDDLISDIETAIAEAGAHT